MKKEHEKALDQFMELWKVREKQWGNYMAVLYKDEMPKDDEFIARYE